MTINLFGRLVNLHARIGNNFIDANVLDRTGKPEDAAVDKILKLAEEGKITLLLPYSVQREIARSNTPADVKRRAGRLIFSMEVQLTPQENPRIGPRQRKGWPACGGCISHRRERKERRPTLHHE